MGDRVDGKPSGRVTDRDLEAKLELEPFGHIPVASNAQ
jgi:hypothetical protein